MTSFCSITKSPVLTPEETIVALENTRQVTGFAVSIGIVEFARMVCPSDSHSGCELLRLSVSEVSGKRLRNVFFCRQCGQVS
jgi:hypothetical protein